MAKIPEATIEQIAAANDIVEVIGGYIPLKRAGSNFRALCPFHQEKTPSFNVSPQRQSYHCFGCGASGSVYRFVMAYENIDFPAAAKKLAERAGIQIVEEEFSIEEDQRLRLQRRLLTLHQEAADWFHQNLLRTDTAQMARAYLKQRGINIEVAKAWKIGYAPDSWDAFTNWALSRDFKPEEIKQSGLVSLRNEGGAKNDFYDRFRDRVMFPICNDQGGVIAFSGRVLQAGAKAAKYVNSPETPLFTKGNVLFGLHKSKRALIDKGIAIVCEGQLDLISAFESGVQNVIASQGTAFTEKQAHILKRHVEEVVLCFDSDSAGQKATERSLAALLAENLIVRVAELPAGMDPDSFIRQHGANAFALHISEAKDFFDFQIDLAASAPGFNNPRKKMQFANKMAAWVSLLTDPVLREMVSNKVSTRIEISRTEFVRLLKRPFRKEEAIDSTPDLLQTEPMITNLIHVALSSAEARSWLMRCDWKTVLGNEPNAELLMTVLAQNINPEDTATINSWLATLTPSEETTIRRILDKGILPISPPSRNDAVATRPEMVSGVMWHPLRTAKDAWQCIERRQINRQISAIHARMRTPDLPFDAVVKLQKEILDLQKQLTDITRPFLSTIDDESPVGKSP